jgi:predicted nucleic acid-binding protein
VDRTGRPPSTYGARRAARCDRGCEEGSSVAAERVAVNGIIQVEIVAFAPNEASYRKLVADFQAFHWLDLGPEEFALAAELGFRLRRQGITVPATDLIIAASGIHGRAL